jgi:hypothetical protein
LFFYPEDEGSKLHRNISGLLPGYTVLRPRRKCENINSKFDSSKDVNDPTSGSCILLGEIAQKLKTFPPLYGTEKFSTVFAISCF